MSNIRHWLEAAEVKNGEIIEAIVVGKHDDAPWDSDPAADETVVLSREDGLKKLDQEYDSGYGCADCYPMWAWTKTRVYFIVEYDGSTRLGWVPRHPVGGEPNLSGNHEISL